MAEADTSSTAFVWEPLKEGEVVVEGSDFSTQIVNTFRQFDVDGNGTISREEFTCLLRILDPDGWDDMEVKKLFEATDVNEDDCIDYCELVNWIDGKSDAAMKWSQSRALLKKAAETITPKTSSSLAACDALKKLAPPDEAFPEDARHVILYLSDFENRTSEFVGQAPADADREIAFRWLHAALNRTSEGCENFKMPIKWLIANFRLWPDSFNPEELGFAELKRLSLEKLDAIGARYEQSVFIDQNIAEQLGSVGDDVPESRPRQDEHLPLLEEMQTNANGAPWASTDDNWAYLALLLTAVHALDPLFQEAVKNICEASSGDVKAPKPKGVMRMAAKLSSDHRDKIVPKTAENIDTNRVACTFDEPSQLSDAFSAVASVFGPPLRVKNGYSSEFDALAVSRGYRNILANYTYAPEGLTWGALAQNEATLSAWDALREHVMEEMIRLGDLNSIAATQLDEFLQCLDEARKLLSSGAVSEQSVSLIVEVQYMLRPYLEMRKFTHYWYKIARAETADALAEDFGA